MTTIDRLDSELLKRLDGNARAGVAELAAQLGISRNTVLARLNRLENAGVLKGFRPVIELEAAGIAVQAFVGLELDQRLLEQVVDALRQVPEVLEVIIQAGREDLLVRVAAVTLSALQEAVGRMISIPGVRHTNTNLTVSTPLPYRVQPLLDHLTQESGWGRSTPLPK
ncbi:Lrp/AsnC family transcriptional regulator [Arthrobacter sp. 2MCAF15]|uniref:Lrp/AsnC family transcriptional regulator n=1 Tax=Arthrobacter sp. 2MCAF15 TaxID=3232984 RepID=UPI003F91A90D